MRIGQEVPALATPASTQFPSAPFTLWDAGVNIATDVCFLPTAALSVVMRQADAPIADVYMYELLAGLYLILRGSAEYNKWRPAHPFRLLSRIRPRDTLYAQAVVANGAALALGGAKIADSFYRNGHLTPGDNLLLWKLTGVAISSVANLTLAQEKKKRLRKWYKAARKFGSRHIQRGILLAGHLAGAENFHASTIYFILIGSNGGAKDIFLAAGFYGLVSALPGFSPKKFPGAAVATLATGFAAAAYQTGMPIASAVLAAGAMTALLPPISNRLYTLTRRTMRDTAAAFIRAGDLVTGRREPHPPLPQTIRDIGGKIARLAVKELPLLMLPIGCMRELPDDPEKLKTVLYGLLPLSVLALKVTRGKVKTPDGAEAEGGVAEACHMAMDMVHAGWRAWRNRAPAPAP